MSVVTTDSFVRQPALFEDGYFETWVAENTTFDTTFGPIFDTTFDEPDLVKEPSTRAETSERSTDSCDASVAGCSSQCDSAKSDDSSSRPRPAARRAHKQPAPGWQRAAGNRPGASGWPPRGEDEESESALSSAERRVFQAVPTPAPAGASAKEAEWQLQDAGRLQWNFAGCRSTLCASREKSDCTLEEPSSEATNPRAGGSQPAAATRRGKQKIRVAPTPGKRTFIHLDLLGEDTGDTPSLQRLADVSPTTAVILRRAGSLCAPAGRSACPL